MKYGEKRNREMIHGEIIYSGSEERENFIWGNVKRRNVKRGNVIWGNDIWK
jgi:hypothetical protein